MFNFKRKQSQKRFKQLLDNDHFDLEEPSDNLTNSFGEVEEFTKNVFLHADKLWARTITLILCLTLGTMAMLLLRIVFADALQPLYFIAGAIIPLSFAKQKSSKLALAFTEDYPSVLLATASSIKSGLTPLQSLTKCSLLLPDTSPIKEEISELNKSLEQGRTLEESLNDFGKDHKLEEVQLFRSAMLLANEHGGKFAPALEQLAQFTRDRLTAMRQARANTASMRVTACVLLCIAPFLLLVVSARQDNFWEIFTTHSVANTSATIGGMLIAAGCIWLWKMSDFHS